jgi:hypothetical protein
MGVTWKTEAQTAFIEGLVPKYHRSVDDKKRKVFWDETFEAWFKRFPLEDPSPDAVKTVGSKQRAIELAREKKQKVSKSWNRLVDIVSPLLQQIKRAFQGTSDNGSNGCLNLHLEEPILRKRSEVQTYMTLYYDTRIRKTVIDRWDKNKIPQLEPSVRVVIPENEVAPEESAIFKDTGIPISFKNSIAQELWEKEDDTTKSRVRSHRDSEFAINTVYNTDGDDRMELLRQYIK